MPNNIPRRVLGTINLRADNGTQVSDRDLHRVGDSALRLARDIDGGPREGKCRRGVNTAGREEGAHVRDARAAGRVGVGEQDNVPDCAEGGGSGDEGGTLVQALGECGYGQRRNEGECVGRDGQELGVSGCVS